MAKAMARATTIASINGRDAYCASSSDLGSIPASIPTPMRTPGLLITLEYPQDKMEGPPFAVFETDVQQLYGDVEELDQRPATGRVADLGLAPIERCYRIKL